MQLTAADHPEIQFRDAVPDDIAVHHLHYCREICIGSVLSGCAPAAAVGVSGRLQEVFRIFSLDNFDIFKIELRCRVGRIEQTAVGRIQRTVLHIEFGSSDFGITGHGLIQDDRPCMVIDIQILHR